MRRDYHPYLGHNYFTRSPRNFCLTCGEKIAVAPCGNWNYASFRPRHGKRILIGYVHSYDCLEPPKDSEQIAYPSL